MEEVNFRLSYHNGHVVFVMKLPDGLFQLNLPIYLTIDQWDDNAQVPVSGTSRFSEKVYILLQTEKSFQYALERLRKQQLKPTMENLSHAWGKTLEKSAVRLVVSK